MQNTPLDFFEEEKPPKKKPKIDWIKGMKIANWSILPIAAIAIAWAHPYLAEVVIDDEEFTYWSTYVSVLYWVMLVMVSIMGLIEGIVSFLGLKTERYSQNVFWIYIFWIQVVSLIVYSLLLLYVYSE
ncbi:MAG: hypothetical protein GY810_04450 [Aureispira sp.]|nr:hypothetical protein [Aureispira sp.]